MVNLISIKELIRPRLCPTEIIFFISIEIWLCEIIYMLQNSEVHVIFFPLSLQISPFFLGNCLQVQHYCKCTLHLMASFIVIR